MKVNETLVQYTAHDSEGYVTVSSNGTVHSENNENSLHQFCHVTKAEATAVYD